MSEGYQPKPSTGTPLPPPKNPDGITSEAQALQQAMKAANDALPSVAEATEGLSKLSNLRASDVTSPDQAHRAAMKDLYAQRAYIDDSDPASRSGAHSPPLDTTVVNGHVVNLRTGIADPAPLLRDTGVDPILPPGVAPLATASLQRHANDAVVTLINGIQVGTVSDSDLQAVLRAIPRDQMRRLVYEYAGMGASLLMTLNKQVALIDSVLSQLVSPEGHLKPFLGEGGPPISLKDAMNLSVKCSQLILRDLPKVYNVERVQRLEMAIGEVMEKHLSAEQQAEVLRRLEELTPDKAS